MVRDKNQNVRKKGKNSHRNIKDYFKITEQTTNKGCLCEEEKKQAKTKVVMYVGKELYSTANSDRKAIISGHDESQEGHSCYSKTYEELGIMQNKQRNKNKVKNPFQIISGHC